MITEGDADMADKTGSGWTFETFRQYVLALLEQFKALREADRITLNAALAAADRAVAKAEAATEKRFESVNEFRSTLSDQAANLMPRAEADVKIQNLAKDLNALSARVEKAETAQQGVTSSALGKREGLTDVGNVLGYIIGGIGAFAVMWTLFHPH